MGKNSKKDKDLQIRLEKLQLQTYKKYTMLKHSVFSIIMSTVWPNAINFSYLAYR